MRDSLVQSAVCKAAKFGDKHFAEHIRHHADSYRKRLSRLRSSSRRAQRDIQHGILTSYSARLICLLRALDPKSPMTPEQIAKTAAALSPFEDCGEPIVAWGEPKFSGDFRPVCAFGPLRGALHLLIVDILSARFAADPVNYLTKGRGSDAANDHLVTLIDAGFEFFVLADVEKFFQSVGFEGLREITQLPKEVINQSVIIGNKMIVDTMGNHINDVVLDEAVRRGIPQGSRASQRIAGMLLGPILRVVAPTDRTIVVGDDAAIAASNLDEAKALTKALPELLAAHPAGPFRLKHCRVGHIDDGFDFVKYRLRTDPDTGSVRCTPAPHCFNRHEVRVAERSAKFTGSDLNLSLDEYTARWTASFGRTLFGEKEMSDLQYNRQAGLDAANIVRDLGLYPAKENIIKILSTPQLLHGSVIDQTG